MYLKTKIAIDYSAGVGTTANGIVEGHLEAKVFMGDMSLKVAYNYKVGDEIIKQASFPVPADQVQGMYDAVKAGLPDPDTDFPAYIETAFYRAFINEMLTTFDGLTAADQVEIVA